MGRIAVLSLLIVIISGCSNSSEPNLDGWNELPDVIISGGVPKDGIPAINDPTWDTAAEGNWLDDDYLVVGVVIDGKAFAYPHKMMDQHEIANEPTSTTPYTVSFCPLTGSSIVFKTTILGTVHTFGVSGLLMQNNLIMFDRQTDSNWPQLRLQADQGSLINTKLDLINHTEIEWGGWKDLHPGTLIMNRNSGGRDPSVYNATFYNGYRISSSSPLFPMNFNDSRLLPKIRVLGVFVEGGAKAYPMNSFDNGRAVINDQVNGATVAVFGDPDSRMMRAFITNVDGQTLTLKLKAGSDSGSLSKVNFIDDETGSIWNIDGKAISGSLSGKKLSQPQSYVAYWFAWSAFNRGTKLWGG
ncbi:MAG: DUF3179 domain-containing protein [Candidatus Marinimicrobia bacterium]|nr:DUF3179 domain-containing protein [Candidatus Neomarinimicrobiota bacterium]